MTTVLIADDVKEMRRLLAQVVESAGFDFVEAKTGDEVIAILQDDEVTIDLILLDIGMPYMDGIQAMHMIRDLDPDVKVCFVSGSKDETVVANAIKAGGDDFVVKPIDVMILIQKIKKLLGHSSDNDFISLETRLKASLPKIPIDIELWVTKLSEVGLAFESSMALKEGETVELSIPKISLLIKEEVNFACQIDSISTNKETNVHVISCSFIGQHENIRAKIRSLTMRGEKLVEDPST